MGHIRLGVLPRSRKWQQVIEEDVYPEEARPETPPHPRPLDLLPRPIQADAALSPHAGRGNRAQVVALDPISRISYHRLFQVQLKHGLRLD